MRDRKDGKNRKSRNSRTKKHFAGIRLGRLVWYDLSYGYRSTRLKWLGAALVQAKGMKTRVFCSAECRKKWWKEHPEMLNKKDIPSKKSNGRYRLGIRLNSEGENALDEARHD